MTFTDRNLDVYNNPRVVAHYASKMDLQACETYAFDKYVGNGGVILDIGVGGGRTTSYLSAKASRYVGVDYSAAMVEACRTKFPAIEVHCEDATDLRNFADASFDAVIFSFNGIDYIPSEEGRLKCLREMSRVLKPGGHCIFSSHNAKVLGVWPNFAGADPLRMAWRVVRSTFKSAELCARSLCSEAFYKGSGYILDPFPGGLTSYSSTPESICAEAESTGFSVSEVVDGLYPIHVSKYFTPWYYYVVVKK